MYQAGSGPEMGNFNPQSDQPDNTGMGPKIEEVD